MSLAMATTLLPDGSTARAVTCVKVNPSSFGLPTTFDQAHILLDSSMRPMWAHWRIVKLSEGKKSGCLRLPPTKRALSSLCAVTAHPQFSNWGSTYWINFGNRRKKHYCWPAVIYSRKAMIITSIIEGHKVLFLRLSAFF